MNTEDKETIRPFRWSDIKLGMSIILLGTTEKLKIFSNGTRLVVEFNDNTYYLRYHDSRMLNSPTWNKFCSNESALPSICEVYTQDGSRVWSISNPTQEYEVGKLEDKAKLSRNQTTINSLEEQRDIIIESLESMLETAKALKFE